MRHGGLFLLWLILFSLFPPLPSIFYYFSFTDEEPGEEEGEEIHNSGNNCFWKSKLLFYILLYSMIQVNHKDC